MTAFVIMPKRERVIIAADTLGYIPDRQQAKPIGFVSKVFPLPHLHSVAFCRGQMKILASVVGKLWLAPEIPDIERAAAAMPELLSGASEDYAEEAGIEDWRAVGLCEAVLIGWSATERRMRLFEFENLKGYEAVDDQGAAYGRTLTMPNLPEEYMPAGFSSMSIDAQLVALIKAEGRYFAAERDMMCGAIIGGEAVSWTVTPDGIAQRTLARLEGYDELRHASAAILGRYARGQLAVDLSEAFVPADQMKLAAEPASEADTPPVINLTPGASRAERRRAEKEARKAGRRAA